MTQRTLSHELSIPLTPSERWRLGETVSNALIEIVKHLQCNDALNEYVQSATASNQPLLEQPFVRVVDQLAAQQAHAPRAAKALESLQTARERLEVLMLIPQLMSTHQIAVEPLISALDRCGGDAMRWSPCAREAANRLSVRLPPKPEWLRQRQRGGIPRSTVIAFPETDIDE